MPRLSYVDDTMPGITRAKVRGDKWGYWDAAGNRITDREEIDRLNAIGLPPAYRDAWFCAKANGHIQATGYDDKGRKQYRYHADFRARQEAEKYERCADFGLALPKLRAQVERDLRRRALTRERAVAAVVRLLDLGSVRIGNESYAKSNKSFGATTLRKRHAKLGTTRLRLQYTAKSGKLRVLTITDRSLISFVRKCQDLPGQHLFRWVGTDGETHPVTSGDVNDYIRAATGGEFTAKHFRTWSASVIAYRAMCQADGPISLSAMLDPVVEALGNTPAIARKSYVHPALIDACKSGEARLTGCRLPRGTKHMDRHERGLIAFLQSCDSKPALARAA